MLKSDKINNNFLKFQRGAPQLHLHAPDQVHTI